MSQICDKCEYKATFESDLTKHKQLKHEGVIYECYQCECKATFKDNPSKHKKSKHEGVGYECRCECDQCEWKIHLTDHIKIEVLFITSKYGQIDIQLFLYQNFHYSPQYRARRKWGLSQ